MALADLIVTNKVLSEDIIENILKGKVELIQEEHKVFLTREALGFPNRLKILLYLTGAKAWELIDKTLLIFKIIISVRYSSLFFLTTNFTSFAIFKIRRVF